MPRSGQLIFVFEGKGQAAEGLKQGGEKVGLFQKLPMELEEHTAVQSCSAADRREALFYDVV